MALVVITVLDDDDGKVDVSLLSEPMLPINADRDPTPAQVYALRMLEGAKAAE